MWVKMVCVIVNNNCVNILYNVYVYVCCFSMLFFSLLSAWRSTLPWEASPDGGAFSLADCCIAVIDIVADVVVVAVLVCFLKTCTCW